MKVGILADAHGNSVALEVALSRLSGNADLLLFAGDAMDQYRFSNEVIDLLREYSVQAVLGNHDRVVLGAEGVRVRTSPGVRLENVDYLGTFPQRLELTLGVKRVLLVHASPWDPNRYVHITDSDLDRFAELNFDYVILGHTHVPLLYLAGNTLVINPGSVGEPRGAAHHGRYSYAVLDTDTDDVVFDSFSAVDESAANVDGHLSNPRSAAHERA